MRNPLVAIIAAVAMMAVLPAGAHAFSANLNASPTNAGAGANSDFTVNLSFAGGAPRNVTLDLPPGQLMDPVQSTPCSVAQFDTDKCTFGNLVGTTSLGTNVFGTSVAVPGSIYLITPQPGEFARLGLRLTPQVAGNIRVQAPVVLRNDGSLQVSVRELPTTDGRRALNVENLTLSLLSGSARFLRNPTSCALATTNLSAEAQDGATATASSSYNPTDCPTLAFAPQAELELTARGQTGVGGRPAATVAFAQGLREAGIQSAVIALPASVGPSPDTLSRTCPSPQVAAGTCPPASELGVGSLSSSVLLRGPRGPARLTQSTGPLPDVTLELGGGSMNRNFVGTVGVTPTGGLTTTFNDLPDIPVTKFSISFTGGQGGLLTNRLDLCGAKNPPLLVNFTGHNGVTKLVNAIPDVEGCTGETPSGPKNLKRATVRASIGRLAAGNRIPLSFGITAQKRARVKRVDVTLPKGLRLARSASLRRSSGTSARVRSPRRMRITLNGRNGGKRATVRVLRGLRAERSLRRSSLKRVRAQLKITFAGGGVYNTRARLPLRR